MSIFGTILQKLGIQKPAAPAAPATPAGPTIPFAGPGAAMARGETPSAPAAAPNPAAMPMVDVVSKLDGMAKSHPGCDWKVSIADLLQLLGMDNSLNARKELATELGCPANLMTGDFSLMNQWLHKTVLQKLAENGGNIPASLIK